MQNSSIDKVMDRIRTIESRIQNISGGFEGPPAVAFADKLQTARKIQTDEKPAPVPDKAPIPHLTTTPAPRPDASIAREVATIHRSWSPADMEIESLSVLMEKNRYPDSLAQIAKKALIQYKKPEPADWLSEINRTNPKKIVQFDGFSMQAEAAFKFRKLKGMIKETFPGRGIYVTSTMGGRHSSPAHPAGRAIDFVVDRLTRDESVTVEQLAKKCGFWAFNEYIHDSTYKTGDHMHIEL